MIDLPFPLNILLAVVAVTAGLASYFLLRDHRRGAFRASPVIVIGLSAVFLITVGAGMVARALGQQYSYYTAQGELVTVQTGPAFSVVSLLGQLTLGLAIVTLLLTALRRRSLRLGWSTVGILLIVSAALLGASSAEEPIPASFFLISSFALLASTGRWSHEEIAAVVTTIACIVAGTSAIYALVGGIDATTPCRPDKCGITGVLYSGLLGYENALGLFLMMTLPFIFSIADRSYGLLAAIAVMVSIFVSGSRSGLIGAVSIALLWILNRVLTGIASERLASWSGVAVSVGSGLALVLLAVSPITDSSEFTGRGQLWQIARQLISDSPLVGIGPSGWVNYRAKTGAFTSAAVYSPHNQLLDLLTVGGLIAATGFLVLLVCWISSASRGLALGSYLVVAVCLGGLLERPVTFGIPDWGSLAGVACVLVASISTVSSARIKAGGAFEMEETKVRPSERFEG